MTFFLQTALSAFFQETNIPYSHHHQMVSAPWHPKGFPCWGPLALGREVGGWAGGTHSNP